MHCLDKILLLGPQYNILSTQTDRWPFLYMYFTRQLDQNIKTKYCWLFSQPERVNSNIHTWILGFQTSSFLLLLFIHWPTQHSISRQFICTTHNKLTANWSCTCITEKSPVQWRVEKKGQDSEYKVKLHVHKSKLYQTLFFIHFTFQGSI